MADLLHKIALSRLKGITTAFAGQLVEMFGSEEELFALPERALYARLGTSVRSLSDQARSEAMAQAVEEAEFMAAHSVRGLYYTDADYPRRLLQCADAPLMLYGVGSADLNAPHVISVIGTRNATVYGVHFIDTLIDRLSEALPGLLVVSGLALGCDVASHKAALRNGVPTAGVVAHGLDTLYPAENRLTARKMAAQGGMIVTDYIHGTRPHRGNFLARNRIVAGLSDATIVVESAAERGGALHTARLAFHYDREVFALPGRTSDHYSGGCNKLIRSNTAHLIESAADLMETMGWEARTDGPAETPLFPELTAEQQAVYDYISAHGEASVNTLAASLAIPAGKLMAALVDMEFGNLLLALPGARYRLA
ncbi:MAG: DNA-processing protein DprA [Muribaculaceae bacterium]|nr:DNA-processing protein DprA [Muribaculaceae bacterium]